MCTCSDGGCLGALCGCVCHGDRPRLTVLFAPRRARVVESGTGAQILPPVWDERAKTTAWHAHSAADADLRTKSKPHADVARGLMIVKESR